MLESSSNNPKLKVGQKVFTVSAKYRMKDKDSEIIEREITKIGRKYFEVSGLRHKFNIDTLIEEIDSNYKTCCYLSADEILLERELNNIESAIYAFFRTYGRIQLPIEGLRTIYKIIKDEDRKGNV